MSSIFSGKAGRQAAMFQAQQLQQGMDQGNAALDQGFQRATDAYGQAAGTLGTLADSYGAGSKLYQDALGVNGTDASTAARSAYATSPGYTFNMDQGFQALTRAGVPITPGNLYVSHFLGEAGGPRFISGAMQNPDAPATQFVTPAAAAASRCSSIRQRRRSCRWGRPSGRRPPSATL